VIVSDVNVYVYAHRSDLSEHEAYAEWMGRHVGAGEPFGVSELALSGFVRVVTNGRIFRTPTPLSTALSFCAELLGHPRAVPLRPGARHWSLFQKLCETTPARGKLVADAYHAALAIEHGCELASADSDFARFEGLRWMHPLRARRT
jgi:uncharacterized protein